MRIQKYLSSQNILSRRKAEEYLQKGWIKVNGEVVTQLGTQIDPEKDVVTFTQDADSDQQKNVTIVFHKPVGVVSNCPEPGQTQITDLLPSKYAHLHTIGRLDRDSEGLILLTDDGVFAKKMLNQDHSRRYWVQVNNPISEESVRHLEEGMMILGKMTLPTTVTVQTPTSFVIELHEGRNRQIRRMVEKIGLRVQKLKRFSYGPVELRQLERGQFRFLTANEKQKLNAPPF